MMLVGETSSRGSIARSMRVGARSWDVLRNQYLGFVLSEMELHRKSDTARKLFQERDKNATGNCVGVREPPGRQERSLHTNTFNSLSAVCK